MFDEKLMRIAINVSETLLNGYSGIGPFFRNDGDPGLIAAT